MPKIILTVNGYKKVSLTLPELDDIFTQYENTEYLEYSISGHGKTAVIVLMNRKSALAVYFRYNGDSGFTTMNSQANNEIFQEFMLSNGQRDEYSENMLVSRDFGYGIIKQYYLMGTRCNLVEWNEEA